MLDILIDKVKHNCNNVDLALIEKAYNLAADAHKTQKRESGEPYIIHPESVASILAELGMDTNTIAAGLLHDVIEDTNYTYNDIKNMFNEEVANLVEGVTKLDMIRYKTKEEQQADNVRKMLLAMAKDIRVIIIKLADRLHNMRTLKFMPEEKQKEKAKETLDIFAPLAHRLGMSKIKWELEDLAFRYLHSEEYYDLVKQIAEKRAERENYIESIINELTENLENAGIDSDIDGRPKHFYSIYRKMVNKNKNIEQIFDLTAIRILVNSVKDCYAALGIVHTIYKPLPGRFKDYIAMPKPNMYQSLHTTVIGHQGKTFEIQIRTFEMHKTAEYGIAAHWKYKEGAAEGREDSFETKLSWLRDMLEWQKDTADAEEFMEGFKMDLFSDEIFVFTPKGIVISLPNDATPIDFAYKIHTDVGNKCVGSKVNGKMVPLDYRLKTGEIVEILTSSVAKGPNIDWLNIATSNQAKSKIKQWFKRAKREENIDKGKDIIEREAKKQLVNFVDLLKGEGYEKLLKKYNNLRNVDDIYAAVGIGMVSASTIISRLKEYNVTDKTVQSNEQITKSIEEHISKGERVHKKDINYGITVKGESNLMVRFAKCCNPVPGDEVVGFITRGRGISVHRKDCTNFKTIMSEEPEKIVEVNWGGAKGAYTAEIQVRSEDRDGLLADIMTVITESKLPLNGLNANSTKTNTALINIKVKIDNVEQLKELMRKIRKLKGVLDVYRMNS
ncbi:bifunctional (p)ppGpp synthetase/guanosine-3',5'-bis(diphosphate) 3'-pyrophosphohydrolase [Clostridium sp. YIM B02505]|uniref:GTP diphosphokinase n=1 Tax=Clostridium yunnanense TaxID=2800325 RepID=A0ABS1EIW7_9CLOT|nr:bifunctional (p)ppGpp synthetase/guanosine-3',5'-bis(diphosphate) 3'-pyrophosphohydrolase [Clostridium yunnanense]MBK1809309.1 bifunctional (p)ppGpp synthetase/guanosine-3',5'-bis(diphosphate) 3'-pyrophosphohydrolase [Clostridium yunnanense]